MPYSSDSIRIPACQLQVSRGNDLAEEQGNARRAVRLWSAADHVGEDVGWAYAGLERWSPEECTGCLAILGDSEFAAAMAAGRGMTWREAAAYALEEEPGASAGHAGAPPEQE